MLTEKEKKKIRRCCIYPNLILAAIIIDLLIGFYFVLLVMIDDMAFNNTSLYMPGLMVYLGIVVVYLVPALVLYVKMRSLGKKESWLSLMHRAGLITPGYEDPERLRQIHGINAAGNLMGRAKNPAFKQAGDDMQAAAAVQTVDLVRRTLFSVKRDALRMAELYRIKVPKTKKYVCLMILAPIVLLTVVFIPEFASSKQAADQERERAAAVVYEVRDALENGCANVIIDDPAEGYQSYGYQIIGLLYDRESKDSSRITLHVGNDGKISEVHYVLTIDIEDTKEANLQRAQQNIETLNALLTASGAPASDDVFLEMPQFPEGFTDQFMNGSYFDGINMHDENANCSAAYSTDPEDVNNEYDSFYFYISMGD